jgi:hypothetical protein
MELSEAALRARARRAYERGRLQAALWYAALLVPVVAWSWTWCPYPALATVCGTALVAFTIVFRWRGQAWARGVGPGLVAGLPPLVLPFLMREASQVCVGEVCCSLCLVGCVGGGLAAGAFVGRRAASIGEGRAAFLAAAGTLALLAGAPACAFAGVAGLTGLVLGFAGGSAPVLLTRSPA